MNKDNRIYNNIMNGDMVQKEWYARCIECGRYIHESHPHVIRGVMVYCPECAFKHGFISEKEYISSIPFPDVERATVHNDRVYIAYRGEKFPWEKTNKDYRQSTEYKNWRAAVFQRDGFKCAICGQVGGELNAHHIRSFKDYPELRFDINNGITLCVRCHRKVHREKNREWIYSD